MLLLRKFISPQPQDHDLLSVGSSHSFGPPVNAVEAAATIGQKAHKQLNCPHIQHRAAAAAATDLNENAIFQHIFTS